MVKTINVKKIYPIHTEYPGKFRELEGKTKLVREDKEYGV